jgi:hypothetical protein
MPNVGICRNQQANCQAAEQHVDEDLLVHLAFVNH